MRLHRGGLPRSNRVLVNIHGLSNARNNGRRARPDIAALLKPDFFSVTYGAGGSTRDGTRQAVTSIHNAGSNVAPHLSFGGSSEEEILALLQYYKDLGITRLVALRGDVPSGTGALPAIASPTY